MSKHQQGQIAGGLRAFVGRPPSATTVTNESGRTNAVDEGESARFVFSQPGFWPSYSIGDETVNGTTPGTLSNCTLPPCATAIACTIAGPSRHRRIAPASAARAEAFEDAGPICARSPVVGGANFQCPSSRAGPRVESVTVAGIAARYRPAPALPALSAAHPQAVVSSTACRVKSSITQRIQFVEDVPGRGSDIDRLGCRNDGCSARASGRRSDDRAIRIRSSSSSTRATVALTSLGSVGSMTSRWPRTMVIGVLNSCRPRR